MCITQVGDLHTDVAAEISLVLDTTPNSWKDKNVWAQIKKIQRTYNRLKWSYYWTWMRSMAVCRLLWKPHHRPKISFFQRCKINWNYGLIGILFIIKYELRCWKCACVKFLFSWHHRNFHTSTLEARKTQVGAMSTGSILFREYLQTRRDTDLSTLDE